jgi:hypothetical protein
MLKKVKLWPVAIYNARGEFNGLMTHTWDFQGDRVTEFGINLPLPPFEVEVEVPDDPNQQLLEVLHQYREKLNADHRNTLTKLQVMENALLRLEAPEVLDAVEPTRPRDDLDDIPF